MRQLFENARIYTLEGVIENGYLSVQDGTIEYVGEARPKGTFDLTRNLSGNLLIPGLVNAHTHTPMTLLRGVGTDLPLKEWLFDTVFPIEAKIGPEDIAAGSALALLEMLAGGIVSFTDMYYFTEETAKLVEQSGIKANLCYPVQEFVPGGTYDKNESCRKLERLYDAWNGAADGRVLIDACIHAEYTSQDDVAQGVAAWAKEKKTGMHVHLSETASEQAECIQRHGMTPAAWMNQMGLLDVPCNAAHCVCLSEEDIEILRQKKVSVAHNPTSNLKLGSGFAPVPELLKRGMNVALGTDGAASNNNLNLFEEMHLAGIIHNGFLQNTALIPSSAVVQMASRNGALSQRREDSGELAAGRKADFAVIDIDKPHLTPLTDDAGLLIYSAQASDVCLTVVNGKILYENGEFKTLDKEKILSEAKSTAKKLLEK